MDQRAGDESQIVGRTRIVVGVVLDEGFVDGFGAIFLADQIEQLGATQIAFEFRSGIGGGVFEFRDGFGVTAGGGECFGELVTDCAGFGGFLEQASGGGFGFRVAAGFEIPAQLRDGGIFGRLRERGKSKQREYAEDVKTVSRKGAKAQRRPADCRQSFFASSRLCVKLLHDVPICLIDRFTFASSINNRSSVASYSASGMFPLRAISCSISPSSRVRSFISFPVATVAAASSTLNESR